MSDWVLQQENVPAPLLMASGQTTGSSSAGAGPQGLKRAASNPQPTAESSRPRVAFSDITNQALAGARQAQEEQAKASAVVAGACTHMVKPSPLLLHARLSLSCCCCS